MIAKESRARRRRRVKKRVRTRAKERMVKGRKANNRHWQYDDDITSTFKLLHASLISN